MKVSEAREKVCPFRSAGMYNLGGNLGIDKDTNCICGDCMAWEMTKEYEFQSFKSKEFNVDLTTDRPKFGKPLSDKEGYCKRLPK